MLETFERKGRSLYSSMENRVVFMTSTIHGDISMTSHMYIYAVEVCESDHERPRHVHVFSRKF